MRRQRNMIGPRKKIMLEEQLVDHPTHYITSIIFSIEYVYRVAIFVQKRYTPPVRKASREVENFIMIKKNTRIICQRFLTLSVVYACLAYKTGCS